jgi:hypothetical protein
VQIDFAAREKVYGKTVRLASEDLAHPIVLRKNHTNDTEPAVLRPFAFRTTGYNRCQHRNGAYQKYSYKNIYVTSFHSMPSA